jgi:hypothetical protein
VPWALPRAIVAAQNIVASHNGFSVSGTGSRRSRHASRAAFPSVRSGLRANYPPSIDVPLTLAREKVNRATRRISLFRLR